MIDDQADRQALDKRSKSSSGPICTSDRQNRIRSRLKEGQKAICIRTKFSLHKKYIWILSPKKLENFAQGQMVCLNEDCQLWQGQMDIRILSVI